MDVRLSFSVAIVVAVVLGEVLSILWYSDSWPWGRYGQRYLLTALLSDVGLAFILQHLVSKYWTVRGVEDAAVLALWLALLYVCLEAPHSIYNVNSFSTFFFHAAHKFVLMFVMTFALIHFKNY